MVKPNSILFSCTLIALSALLIGCSPASNIEQPVLESSSEPSISWAQVQENSTMDSCWIVLKGNVYVFSQVVQQHPFGAQLSNAVCGKDATQTFTENADINEVTKRLKPFYLGPVG